MMKIMIFTNYYLITMILILTLYFKFTKIEMPIFQLMLLILLMMYYWIYMNMFSKNLLNWMLIMISILSGLMVLFAYFCSIMNNPMNLMFNYKFLIYFTIMNLIMSLFLYKNYKLNYLIINKLNLINIYLNYKIWLMLMMITLLLITLYMIYKICFISKKSLRSKN
uniref:NADH dehydrogenase subunit 6 n=1 Tax=Tetrapedia diversipes TaxID=889126 RepID=UPI001EF9FB97|nr:NADH dehydrogenase subunit 6 [Tetrapedia diversipes]UKG21063.1 NADH dehydrogenase subunit 6 [Tetrapedia diversipes]